jgi:hypothetical protein
MTDNEGESVRVYKPFEDMKTNLRLLVAD